MATRHVRWLSALGVAALISALSTALEAQVGGNLAQYPPTDLNLEIATAPGGEPVLSVTELELTTGDYYRLNVTCTDVEDDLSGWRLELPQLLQNVHLRLVSVGDIEIHLQGLSFHAIECDEVGSVHISFVPIRPGTYELYVGNVPLAVGRPPGESGMQAAGKFALGRFVVK
jgi:hypothetical protein